MKLIALAPRPTLSKRIRCWPPRPGGRHSLQLCASAITGRLTWRCRRCTGHFAKPTVEKVGLGGVWTEKTKKGER